MTGRMARGAQNARVSVRLAERPAFRPLAERNFRLLLAGSAVVGVLMPLHLMTQVFWVSQHFADDAVLYSSILAAARGAGMVVFSMLGGAIADRADRRRVLLTCEGLSFFLHGAIALLMLFEPLGAGSVGLVAVVTFLGAGVQSVDGPARSAMVPAAAGRENVGAAIALLSISGQLSMPLSLPIAGLMNQFFAPGAVYLSTLLAWVVIMPLIAALRVPHTVHGLPQRTWRSIGEGLAYTRGNEAILAIISLVVVVQVLGMAVATPLGPMFEIEVLGFNSAQVGLMGATWGLGSLTAGVFFARASGLTRLGATLPVVAAIFGVAILGFGYSRFVPLTAVADYGMGFAFTGTGLVASTLIQHLVADEMRGRVLAFFPLSIGLAQAATAVAGVTGEVVGLAVLLPALGWLVLASVALLAGYHRALLARRVEPAPAPAGSG